MKDKKVYIPIIILFILVMLALYAINSGYMMAPDEYNYSNIAWTDHRLSSISDIITSQMSMYKQWTGRIPVHTIIQTMLYLGTWTFQIINPIIFAIFLLLITNMIFKKVTYFKTILALFLICFLTKGLGEKYIWLSGSVNYLWTTTSMLVVMYFYYKIFEKDEKLQKYQIPIFLIFSFFAGWSQENVAFVLGSYIIIIGLSNLKKFKGYSVKEKATIITGIILFVIGALLLIFAPGNLVRMGTNETGLQIENIITRFIEIKYLIVLYIITLIVLFIINVTNKKENTLKVLKNQILFILPIIIGLLPMIIIAEFPTRSMLPYEIMIIIIIIANTQFIINKYNLKKLVKIASVIISIPVIYMFIRNVSYSEKYMKPYKEKIEQEINLAKIESQTDVVLSRFEEVNYLQSPMARFLVDYSPKTFSTNIINTYMATYYGFNTIQAIGDNEYLVDITLNSEIENAQYNLLDSNNTIIRTSLYDNTLEKTNKIQFIILKEEFGNVKITLPEDLENKIQKVELKSVLKSEEIDLNKIVTF